MSITIYTPTFDPTPDWLQEALSHRHSTRSIILVGLEDGRYAVLDEQTGARRYLVCDSLSDVEKEVMGLRDRTLQRAKPTIVVSAKAQEAQNLLRELGLLP